MAKRSVGKKPGLLNKDERDEGEGQTHRVVSRAGTGQRPAPLGLEARGATYGWGVVQVLVVEELLRVHADGSTHVQAQFLLQ